MGKRSVRIEKRSKHHYEVIKVRADGVAFSVGSARTKTKAKRIKKKNLWSKRKR